MRQYKGNNDRFYFVIDINSVVLNEKRVEFDLAPYGVLGLEQSFVQLIKNSGDSEKLENSLRKSTKKMSEKPREILTLNELKVSRREKQQIFLFMILKQKQKLKGMKSLRLGKTIPKIP